VASSTHILCHPTLLTRTLSNTSSIIMCRTFEDRFYYCEHWQDARQQQILAAAASSQFGAYHARSDTLHNFASDTLRYQQQCSQHQKQWAHYQQQCAQCQAQYLQHAAQYHQQFAQYQNQMRQGSRHKVTHTGNGSVTVGQSGPGTQPQPTQGAVPATQARPGGIGTNAQYTACASLGQTNCEDAALTTQSPIAITVNVTTSRASSGAATQPQRTSNIGAIGWAPANLTCGTSPWANFGNNALGQQQLSALNTKVNANSQMVSPP
jgi:hypothetical protein